jgi:hypothetical protein
MQEPDSSDTITLLVINDDLQVGVLCGKCLARAGFRVLEADNSLEALLIARTMRGSLTS